MIILCLEIVCVGVGLFYYTKLTPSSLRLLLIYSAALLLIDLFLELEPDTTGMLTRSQYDVMLPTEYAIFVYIFKPKLVKIFRIITIGLVCLGLYQLIIKLQDQTSSTTLFLAVYLLLLPVVLLYFWSLATSNKLLTLNKEPLFWIATALLFSCTGGAIVTGFYFFLSDRFQENGKNLFYINYVLTAIRYGMFTVAFAVAGRNQDGS